MVSFESGGERRSFPPPFLPRVSAPGLPGAENFQSDRNRKMAKNTDTPSPSADTIRSAMEEIGERARIASRILANTETKIKDEWLLSMADALENSSAELLRENARDMKVGRDAGLSGAMLDRLQLTPERIKAMADGLRHVTSLEDPVGRRLSTILRPNGLRIEKVSVPIGVIGFIYESRPNVTADAAGLCLKAGNAVILRGGSEAFHSNMAIAQCISHAAVAHGMPEGAVQLIPWTDRAAVANMLKMDRFMDLIIPRGGEGLIRYVVENSTIPVIKHYKGICHIFVDSECNRDMALDIIENAKCQRPGVCNALETLLIHEDIAESFVPAFAARMKTRGVELRGANRFCELVKDALPASEEDWSTEYLDLILSVRIVPDLRSAVEHINHYGSGHSDCIVTDNPANAEYFLNHVDSAAVYVNASIRFTDGGEFGMGAEIGISTDKLHARGPMGLPELTSYKYKIYGSGQIR